MTHVADMYVFLLYSLRKNRLQIDKRVTAGAFCVFAFLCVSSCTFGEILEMPCLMECWTIVTLTREREPNRIIRQNATTSGCNRRGSGIRGDTHRRYRRTTEEIKPYTQTLNQGNVPRFVRTFD